ncbi:MAG TPA: hypothetical protein VFL85_05400 [Candidatus Saccharimonadales bacterium]|nr:hypothetical protein [Candidatus Saccharimonadales bacterium]
MAETVTMSDLRRVCDERLDQAVAAGNAEVLRLPDNETGEAVELSEGVVLARGAGALSVTCVFHTGLAPNGTVLLGSVEFEDGKVEPVSVKEVVESEPLPHDRMVGRRRQDLFAAKIANLLNSNSTE